MPTSIAAWFTSRGTAALPGYFISSTPWAGYKSAVGVTSRSQASTALSGGNAVQSGAPAINDELTIDHYLNSGTYKIAMVHVTANNRAIYTMQYNGSSQGTIDGYSAGATENVYSELTGLTVTAGVKTVKVLAASKNASSSDYYVTPQTIAHVRTGA